MSRAAPAVAAALLVALVAAACLSALLAAERARPAVHGLAELSYFPNGKLVRLVSAGHSVAWADLAWFQTIQYYGKHRKSDQDFHMLRHLAAVIADLDPHFLGVYRFVGFSLGQEGHDFPAGMAVLQRAVADNPGRWEPWFDAGFLEFVGRHDYKRASYYLAHAAQLPGHPEYVDRLAGWVAGKAGYAETAEVFWTQILLTSENDYLREMARKYLDRLHRKGHL
ncbi:MAG TPA: hypothetical protein VMS93_12015 [Candidatus Saccharimonadales bacterium]|nr:hypothetical protein [Candidatus Saccharimonadales bacterium]